MSLAHLVAAKESLESRLATASAELAALSVTTAGGKPDAVDGVKHQAYKNGLVDEITKLQEQIDKIKDLIAANDADGIVWEVISEQE